MKKILLCCAVVVLTMIICVVPSFAASGVASSGSFNITMGDYDILHQDNEFTSGLISSGSYVVFSCSGYAVENGVNKPFEGIVFNAPDAGDWPPGQWTLHNGDIDVSLDYGVTLHFTSSVITYQAVGDITHEQIVAGFNDYIGTVYNEVPIASPIESVLTGFSVVLSWIPITIVSLIGLFWTGSELTFLGILSVCGLAIAVFLLIFAFIRNFLHFRG